MLIVTCVVGIVVWIDGLTLVDCGNVELVFVSAVGSVELRVVIVVVINGGGGWSIRLGRVVVI